MATTSYAGKLKNVKEGERKENNTSDAGKFKNEKEEEGKEENSMFECNICLDTAKDAVVSMCGHLFCWPCLHQWLETRPTRQLCPVCKATISREKVVPLYGRGTDNTSDPRDKVPPRPAGQRTEPENNNTYPGFGFGEGGFHMSFGMAFPFGFVQSTWQSAAQAAENTHPQGAAVAREDEAMSKVFFFFAVLVIIWLLFN